MHAAMERAGGKDIFGQTRHRFDFSVFERIFRQPDWNDTEFSFQIGATRDQVRAWRKKGIPFFDADKLCIAMGYHPCLIWGDEYWNAPRFVLKKYRHLIQEENK